MKKFWVLAGTFVLGLLFGFSIYAFRYHKPNSANAKAVSTVVSLASPPSYVQIKGERWSVYDYDFNKLSSLSPSAMAFTDCAGRNIWYDPTRIRNAPEYRETMWHEVVHAEHCNVTADSLDGAGWEPLTHDLPEHAGVYELGMFLPGFVHDNPDFMKWAEDWE